MLTVTGRPVGDVVPGVSADGPADVVEQQRRLGDVDAGSQLPLPSGERR
jgi:hypothetical protein